jgi:hypothetical protein
MTPEELMPTTVTAESALAFLRKHQPMPSDREITDEQGDKFVAILEFFEATPDERCIPLFVGAVSPGTTLGMYESIRFIFMAFPKETVSPHLLHGLKFGNDGTKHRCCLWATDIDAWELEPEIRPLASHSDEDVQWAAETFLEFLPKPDKPAKKKE